MPGSKPGERRGGRSRGTPNRVTRDVREALAAFTQGNVGKLQEWLEQVAANDPFKAADLFLRVLEYHLPKLARTETNLSGSVENTRRLIISDE
jgi:hypothetical protein